MHPEVEHESKFQQVPTNWSHRVVPESNRRVVAFREVKGRYTSWVVQLVDTPQPFWHGPRINLVLVSSPTQALLESFYELHSSVIMSYSQNGVSQAQMDADLYDEFGNYIGPELESEDEEEESFSERQPDTQEYDACDIKYQL
uniref:116kDa U5 small nuclear ribonucleoprotein component N-terminal domain-containing protein n=1 Tax=Timema tahoe TaxID=61484 RepID=A0A7R9NXW0_9NEOP|nr:unnamed protein product [Timema tahoe]